MSSNINSPKKNNASYIASVEKILETIDKINFGSVTLIIQDGVIVQVDRHEKIRIK